MTRISARTAVLALTFVALSARAQGSPLLFSVTVDTSTLVGNPTGPFALDFQLIDGGGLRTNTVVLSGFDFGSGAPTGVAALTGGATGDLSSVVTLTDAGPTFLNEFLQSFTAGAALRFDVSLTTEVEPGGTPDAFSLAILDGSAHGIPTSFFDVFVVVDIDSGAPPIRVFGSVDPVAAVPAPTIARVPEPSGGILLGVAWAALRRWRCPKRRPRSGQG